MKLNKTADSGKYSRVNMTKELKEIENKVREQGLKPEQLSKQEREIINAAIKKAIDVLAPVIDMLIPIVSKCAIEAIEAFNNIKEEIKHND